MRQVVYGKKSSPDYKALALASVIPRGEAELRTTCEYKKTWVTKNPEKNYLTQNFRISRKKTTTGLAKPGGRYLIFFSICYTDARQNA